MSFICGLCGEATKPGEKSTPFVLVTREVEYSPRSYKRHGQTVNDPGGFGNETVVEVKACPKCVAEEKIAREMDEFYEKKEATSEEV